MRDAAGALDRAKKALAIAIVIAQEGQEGQRQARIEDLETRAVAAIAAERDDLATEAAEAIATLEAERDASLTTRTLFAATVSRGSPLPMPLLSPRSLLSWAASC
jgi:phage shock protein A